MANGDYAYAVARVRSAEAGLIPQAQLDTAINCQSVSDVFEIIEKYGYDKSFNSEHKLYKLWGFAFELAPGDMLWPLCITNEFHNLKAAFRLKILNAAADNVFITSGVITPPEAVLKAVMANDLGALPGPLKDAAQAVFESLGPKSALRDVDILVDKLCLLELKRCADKTKDKVVKAYMDTIINYADINACYRMLQEGFYSENIEPALADSGQLESALLAKSAMGGIESFYEYIASTPFKEVIEILKAGGGGLYKYFYDRLITDIKPQRINPFTFGPIAAFIIAGVTEVRNVRTILLLKNAGLKSDDIRLRSVISYV